MKLKFLATAILLSPLFWAGSTRAENPEHVRQLLKTKSCQECDLTGANLSGVDLSFAILVGANLTGANLTSANLSNADLSRANLSQTNLSSANLTQAYLTNANLDRTRLVGASLNGAKGVPIMNPPLTALSRLPRPVSLPRLYSLPPLPPQQPGVILRPPAVRPLTIRPSRQQTILRPAPLSSSLPALRPPVQPIPDIVTTSQQPPNSYPPSLVRFFVNSCSKRGNVGGVNIEPICVCSMNKIQNEYTLDQFMSIALDMADNKKTPDRLVQIATECAAESLSR